MAGSHSTSGTLTLLFWHLFHNPAICGKIVDEISTNLSPLDSKDVAYSIKGLEASLPFTMACVRENFRLNPVFTMPLWRRVESPSGATIGEFEVPYGVSILLPLQVNQCLIQLLIIAETDQCVHIQLRTPSQSRHLGPGSCFISTR